MAKVLFFWLVSIYCIYHNTVDLEMLAACCKTLSYGQLDLLIQKQLIPLVILTALTTLIANVKKG